MQCSARLLLLLVLVRLTWAQTDADWWRHAVIYEIYPRSFADTNGDGVGDLNGITKHLDYLNTLGVDAIWISPFFPSPQVDFGYDISDYEAIDPRYGSMADFDRLQAEANKRHLRVILDFVVNHTSDKHPWFVESRSSRTNPKADWFIWRDAKPDGKPPNNWQSIFGHSAWQWDATRKQFYYHAFYKEQPDLNWRNPEVRKAMYDVMRFWMKKGVAGFRLDAVTSLFEDLKLRDESVRPGLNAYGEPIVSREYTDNLPELHEVLREMRHVVNEFPGRVLIGETYVATIGDLAKMYGAKNDELQLPMDTQFGFVNKLSAAAFRVKLRDAEMGLNGNTPLLVFDNHDNRRSWNRYGDGEHNAEIAKVIATLLLTPRDVALMYYGQELGMENNDPKRVEDVQDPIGRIGWPKEIGRDGERTPMQWTPGPLAGFTTGKTTWLPIPPSYKTHNVQVEEREPNSLFHFYTTLIRLRKDNAALRDGSVALVNENDPNVLAYVRKSPQGQTVLVAVNCTGKPQMESYSLGKDSTTVLSTFAAVGAKVDLKKLELPAFGVYIGEIK